MRKIKFKFWCLGTSENLNFNKKGWWSYPNFLLDKYHDNLDIFESPDFVACQFTGLQDKNGKDIYEGDILMDPTNPDEFGYYSIYFKDGCFWLDDIWLYDYNQHLVVMGNIYENPELLNNETRENQKE